MRTLTITVHFEEDTYVSEALKEITEAFGDGVIGGFDCNPDRQSYSFKVGPKKDDAPAKPAAYLLTGSDIFRLFSATDSSLRWEDVPLGVQRIYSRMAKKVNQLHIQPLQGLVKDYQGMQQKLYQALYAHAGDSEDLEDEMSALNIRAQTFIGGQ